MSVTNIPGTNYTIQDNQIRNADGKEVSQDAFVGEVMAKGINLSSDALKVLGDKFGADYESKLQYLGTVMVGIEVLQDKLKEGGDTGNLMLKMMLLVHKTAMEQRQASRELADKTVDLQIQTIGEQVEKMKGAALTRLVTGLVTAAFQIGMGMMQMKMSAKAGVKMDTAQKAQMASKQNLSQANQFKKMGASAQNQKVVDGFKNQATNYQNIADTASMQARQIQTSQQTYSMMGQSTSSVMGSVGNYVASMLDADVKELDKDATKFAHMTDNAKKLFDEATDLERKVRDILQSMEQSESQAQRSIANMS